MDPRVRRPHTRPFRDKSHSRFASARLSPRVRTRLGGPAGVVTGPSQAGDGRRPRHGAAGLVNMSAGTSVTRAPRRLRGMVLPGVTRSAAATRLCRICCTSRDMLAALFTANSIAAAHGDADTAGATAVHARSRASTTRPLTSPVPCAAGEHASVLAGVARTSVEFVAALSPRALTRWCLIPCPSRALLTTA